MQHNTANEIEAIRLACKYTIRRAFKLFDHETRLPSLQRLVGNLRLTSKALNNSICDELSLEVMQRWMKSLDRAVVVESRIQHLLQKNDRDGLITFMDLVSKIFANRPETVRLLSSFLIPITQHYKHILKDYIDFFASRKLHMTLKEYFEKERKFQFPGFNVHDVEKALQIANENGWIEESILLASHFESNYWMTETNFRTDLATGVKLNFDVYVANRIRNMMKHREAMIYFTTSTLVQSSWYSRYLEAKQIRTTNVEEILHNVNFEEAKQLLVEIIGRINNMRHCRIISFRGSQLTKIFYRRQDVMRRCFEENIRPKTKDFTGLPPPPESRQRIYLYNFYQAIAKNDIESVKRIHIQHGINVKDFGHHPHPLWDYMRILVGGFNGSWPQLIPEMIEYLIEHFDGVEECLKKHPWTEDNVLKLWCLEQRPSESRFIIKYLIEKGAKIDNAEIWKKLFDENRPKNTREFRALLDKTTEVLSGFMIEWLFSKFSIANRGMITETKLILLLAWRYDDTCHLSKLPKELLKLIVDYINEPPFFIQCARMVANNSKKITYIYPISSEALEHTGEIAKFVRDYVKSALKNPWTVLSKYPTERAVKRDVKYLMEIFMANNDSKLYDFPKKVHRYFCKYGTDDKLLKLLVKEAMDFPYSYKTYPLLEYAAMAQNIKLLNAYYSARGREHRQLDEDIYASIGPNRKNKISYQQALELVNSVREKYPLAEVQGFQFPLW